LGHGHDDTWPPALGNCILLISYPSYLGAFDCFPPLDFNHTRKLIFDNAQRSLIDFVKSGPSYFRVEIIQDEFVRLMDLRFFLASDDELMNQTLSVDFRWKWSRIGDIAWREILQVRWFSCSHSGWQLYSLHWKCIDRPCPEFSDSWNGDSRSFNLLSHFSYFYISHISLTRFCTMLHFRISSSLWSHDRRTVVAFDRRLLNPFVTDIL
jgi:hypothetical protein